MYLLPLLSMTAVNHSKIHSLQTCLSVQTYSLLALAEVLVMTVLTQIMQIIYSSQPNHYPTGTVMQWINSTVKSAHKWPSHSCTSSNVQCNFTPTNHQSVIHSARIKHTLQYNIRKAKHSTSGQEKHCISLLWSPNLVKCNFCRFWHFAIN